jgi:predicted RNA-binding Zn-ribbon protein involved in translation (DUF1610 family)
MKKEQPARPSLEYESRMKALPDDDEPAYQCPKCGGNMIAGYCIDMKQGGAAQNRWAKGRPRRMRFFLWTIWALDLRKVPLFDVTSFACSTCGYLESFLR